MERINFLLGLLILAVTLSGLLGVLLHLRLRRIEKVVCKIVDVMNIDDKILTNIVYHLEKIENEAQRKHPSN